MKKFLFVISTLIILVSCDKEVLYKDFVQLSLTSYTFDSTNPQPLEINVKTNNSSEWSLTIEEGDWIEYTLEPNKIIIIAKSNESSENRTAKLVVTSGSAKANIDLNQLAYGFSGTMMDFPLTSLGGISRSGNYAGYVSQTLDEKTDDFIYECYVYNTETCEQIKHTVPTITTWEGVTTSQYYDEVKCVSDDGNTILYYNSSATRGLISSNEQTVELQLPDKYINAVPTFFSSDASVVVGVCRYEEDRMMLPVVWKNGVPEILEVPEFLANGNPIGLSGVLARGCSNDGSVIYGSEWSLFGLIYWKNGTMVDIGSKYAEKLDDGNVALIQTHSSSTNISPNGKFIAAYFNANGRTLGGIFYPAIVNTETGEATIYREYEGYLGIHAMNDGTLFVERPMSSDGASVIDYKTGEIKPISEWSKERYGLTITDNRFVQYVNEDEQIFFGMKLINGGVGVLTPNWFLRR